LGLRDIPLSLARCGSIKREAKEGRLTVTRKISIIQWLAWLYAANDERTGLRRVDELAAAGKIRKLLVHETSRIARRNSVAINSSRCASITAFRSTGMPKDRDATT
jgi:hypothetical protein